MNISIDAQATVPKQPTTHPATHMYHTWLLEELSMARNGVKSRLWAYNVRFRQSLGSAFMSY